MAQPHLQGPRGYWLPLIEVSPAEFSAAPFYPSFYLFTGRAFTLLQAGIPTYLSIYLPVYLATCI